MKNLSFVESESGYLSDAKCIKIIAIEDNKVVDMDEEKEFDPYFQVLVTFNDDSDYYLDNVPTSSIDKTSPSPNEIILTDGDDRFLAARHLLDDDDPNLYVLDELPDRLQNLTEADKELIIQKVIEFCS